MTVKLVILAMFSSVRVFLIFVILDWVPEVTLPILPEVMDLFNLLMSLFPTAFLRISMEKVFLATGKITERQ